MNQLDTGLEEAVSDLAHGAFAKIAADSQARVTKNEPGPNSTISSPFINIVVWSSGLLSYWLVICGYFSICSMGKSETAVSNSCWSCSPILSMTLPSIFCFEFY